VAKLNLPARQVAIETVIRKVKTKAIEDAPEDPLHVDDTGEDNDLASLENKRGPDKEPRRNQSASEGRKYPYRGRTYQIEPVDMGRQGDLVRLDRELTLIEINEKHRLYEDALKNDQLDRTQISLRNKARTDFFCNLSQMGTAEPTIRQLDDVDPGGKSGHGPFRTGSFYALPELPEAGGSQHNRSPCCKE